jgi:subtilisin family serine protease
MKMKEEYTILRLIKKDSSNADGLAFTSGADPGQQYDIKNEIDELNASEATKIGSENGILAVTPTMPISLVESCKTKKKFDEFNSGNIAWGINAVGADVSKYTGTGIVVAVLDSGILQSHPAFNGIQIIEKDFTGEGNGDLHGHGTHCAGTFFGNDVEGKRIGVAKGIKKALIGKVFNRKGKGTTTKLIDGILWAFRQGSEIISMSVEFDFPGYSKRLVDRGYPIEIATSKALFGYWSNCKIFEDLSTTIADSSKFSFSQSTILIAAAGNASKRSESVDYDVIVAPPAASKGIVSVAALEKTKTGLKVAPFSNSRPSIAGPGVNILSADINGGLIEQDGTSMAAPHVAGVAALWAQKIKSDGSLSAEELQARLIASGTKQDLFGWIKAHDVGSGLVKAPTD